MDQGVKIYDLMCAFTGTSGAIRQAEFFVYHPSDRGMLEAALERFRGGAPVEPTTWIRASRQDAALVGSLGVRETGMLASASDYHTFYKFTPGGRSQAARTYLDAVRSGAGRGLKPRLHLEDATRAPREFLLPLVEAVLALAAPYGATGRPKFRSVRHDGTGPALRRGGVAAQSPRMVCEVWPWGSGVRTWSSIHTTTPIWSCQLPGRSHGGCGAINGTLLGKGERTGNAPLEGVLLQLLGWAISADRPLTSPG